MVNDEGEKLDKRRYLEITIKSWIYDCSEPEIEIEPFTNKIWYDDKGQFVNNRKDWRRIAHDAIIAKLTYTIIDYFGNRGIDSPAGENCDRASIDWDFEILSARFKYISGCPEEVLESYRRVKGRVEKDDKEYKKLEKEEQDILSVSVKKRTDSQKRRLRKIEDEKEKILRRQSIDKRQLERYETECPGIENFSTIQ